MLSLTILIAGMNTSSGYHICLAKIHKHGNGKAISGLDIRQSGLIVSLISHAIVSQMSMYLGCGDDAETCQHERPHQCPECGRGFESLSDVRSHLEAVHSIFYTVNHGVQGVRVNEEESFNNWTEREILHSIHESIDWLHRLSNMVRKASFSHQNKRADDFMLRDKNGERSHELTRSLLDGLTRLYQFYVRTHAAGVGEQLAQRLVQTMIIRHKRILYRRARQKVWNLEQINYTPRKTEQESHHLRVSLPAPETTAPSSSKTTGLPQPTAKIKMAESQFTATTVDKSMIRKVIAQSEVSKATSNSLFVSDQVLVPPRPATAKSGNKFVCDYCGLLLQAHQASNVAAWA